MKIYKISQNIQYLQSLGIPQENLQDILNILTNIDKTNRSKYLKYLKNNPTITPQQLQSYQPLSKEDYLQQKVSKEVIQWAKDIDQDYYEWVIKQYQNKSIMPKEDDKKTSSALQLFKDLNNKKMISKELSDINRFRTFPELYQELKKYKNTDSENIIIDEKDPNLIYNQDGIQILEVIDPSKASMLAKGTNWCTQDVETANSYIEKKYPLYIIIVDGVKTAQIHLQSNQIKDINDEPLQDYDIIKRIDPVLRKLDLIPEDKQEDFEDYSNMLEKANNITRILSMPDGLERFKSTYHNPLENIKYIPKNIIDSKPEVKQYIINSITNPSLPLTVDDKYRKYTSNTIRNIPEIKQYFIKEMPIILEEYPNMYFRLGNELRKIPEIQKARKSGVIHRIVENTYHSNSIDWTIPEDLKDDKDVLNVFRKQWLVNIENINNQNRCPEILRNDPEIKEIGKQAWIEYFNDNPGNITALHATDIPKFISNTITQEEIKNVWIKYLQDNPVDNDYIDYQFQDLPSIQDAFQKGWVKYINEFPLDRDLPHLALKYSIDYPNIAFALKERGSRMEELQPLIKRQKQRLQEQQTANNKSWYKIANSFIHQYYSPRQKQLNPQEEHIRNIAQGLAKGDIQAIQEAAKDMAKYVPSNTVLVPIPSSQGNTSNNLKLAQEIAKITNCKVMDILTSQPRDSQKSRRRQGIPGHKTEDIKTDLTNMCDTNNIILIDNVRTTGATIDSAKQKLPCASYLVYAQAEEILNWYDKAKSENL